MTRRGGPSPLTAVLSTAALSTAVLGGCGTGGTAGAAAPRELTVFAAASLAPVFPELGERFEAAHPGTTVRFGFAGSSDLVTQVREGAPADVLAVADADAMASAAADGLLDGAAVDFATNTLVVVTPPDDPARISSFADLARPGAVVVVCAAQVPCGRATARAEEVTGVDLDPVSEESSVTGVLGKVRSGEADAGVVYATDARRAADAVRSVPVPEAAGVVNTYPIAAVAGSEHPDVAREFVTFVHGPEARQVLRAAGFGTS